MTNNEKLNIDLVKELLYYRLEIKKDYCHVLCSSVSYMMNQLYEWLRSEDFKIWAYFMGVGIYILPNKDVVFFTIPIEYLPIGYPDINIYLN